MEQLVAYLNNPKLKQEVLDRMQAHIDADQLVQREGWDEKTQKGCAIGCAIDCYDQSAFSKKLGLERWIPAIYDRLHESLELSETPKFNMTFLKSLQVGMTKEQSTQVRIKWLHYILTETFPKKYQSKTVLKVIELLELTMKGVKVSPEQWREARHAADADAAAADAADAADAAAAAAAAADADADAAAADAAAADAAAAAADAAAAAAADAADAADADADADAGRPYRYWYYRRYRHSKLGNSIYLKCVYKLCELFSEVKV